jgi:GNAT superfamily N-acetyltransferase
MRPFSAIPTISLRTFSDDSDYERLCDLWLACRQSFGWEGAITADDLKNQSQWKQHFDPYRQQYLVFDEGHLIGSCAHNWSDMGGNLAVFHVDGMLLPQYWQTDLPEAMLNLMEERSREMAAGLPEEKQCFLSSWLPQKGEAVLDFYLAHGYQKTRYFIEMVRPTSLPLAAYPLPQGVEIRPVDEEHLRQIFEAENEATHDHWGHIEYGDEQYLAWLDDRRCQPHIWKVAWEGKEICGMVRSYVDELENQTEQRLRGYTEFISVRRPWRRKGLAKALLAESIRMFRDMGMQETALGVDTENPSSALALYHNMGYTENRDKTYLVVTKPLVRQS